MFPLHVHLKVKVDILPFILCYKEGYPWHKYIVSIRCGALANDLFFFAKSMFAFVGGKTRWIVRSYQPIFRSPMNCVFVHASSTFEFGVMRSDCLVQFSILTLFRSPMNGVFVHVSSTFEFGAMRSDCLVQFSILNPFFGAP